MSTQQMIPSPPKGFRFAGIQAGLKKEIRKDLGLIVTRTDAAVGAVYTRNRFPSAHVQYCRKLTPNNQFRALVINSGNANAATGEQGLADNISMARGIAERLGVKVQQVLTSSTGIIGHPFPIATIEAALDNLVESLGDTPLDTAEAIMTTDTTIKLFSEEIVIAGTPYTVMGFAKGSGMIHPNMGTMLAYILTDAPIPFSRIQSLTEAVADQSFNCISVDGDTSTNDSFYLITSQPTSDETTVPDELCHAITQTAISLSRKIAADGEGAEHLLEVTVKGVPDHATAKPLVDAVLTSSLVKTAVNGKDPNWGRILMAVGNGLNRTAIKGDPVMSISIQGLSVYSRGEPQHFDEKALSEQLAEHDVSIEVDLHQGAYSLTGWGCDFSTEYVRINADYST